MLFGAAATRPNVPTGFPAVLSIDISPANGPVGTEFTATVTVAGSPTPDVNIQWQREGVDIDGEDDDGLVSAYTSTQVGVLRVKVTATNAVGTTVSYSTLATVYSVPVLSNVVVAPSSGSTSTQYTVTYDVAGFPAPTVDIDWQLDAVSTGDIDETHIPASEGTLTAVLTATNVGGSDEETSNAVEVSNDFTFVNAEAGAYVGRMQTPPAVAYQQGIDNFTTVAKGIGLGKFEFIHLFRMGEQDASYLDLRGNYDVVETGGAIDFTEGVGVRSAGGYLATTLLPSAMSVTTETSAHFAVEIAEGSSGTGVLLGPNSGLIRFFFNPKNSNGFPQLRISSNVTIEFTGYSPADRSGFWVITRNGNSVSLHHNGVKRATVTAGTAALSGQTTPITLFDYFNSRVQDERVGFYSFGSYLTDFEVTTLYNGWEAYKTDIATEPVEIDNATAIAMFAKLPSTLTPTWQNAINTFFNTTEGGLDTAGEHSHIHFLSLPTAADAVLNSINNSFTLSISGTVTHLPNEGFRGGDTVGHLDLGVTPAGLAADGHYAQDDCSVTIIIDAADADDVPVLGTSGIAEADVRLYANFRSSTGNAALRVNGTPGATLSSSTRIGVWTIVRESATEVKLYRNGTLLGTLAQNSSAFSQSTTIQLFNYLGVNSHDTVSFWASGAALSAAQVAEWYAAIDTLRTTVGLTPDVPDSALLSWDPDVVAPVSSPTIINLNTGYDGGNLSGENTDYVLVMPPTAKTGRIFKQGVEYTPAGRNIRMIGGKFGPFSTSGGTDPWIRILNCKGGGAGVGANAFFEGIDIDSSAAQMDGFQWGGCERWVTPNNNASVKLYDPNDPYNPNVGSRIQYYADSLYIQNCRITGQHGTGPGYHADWFHNDGGLTNIRIDRCDFETTYQGFFVRENATANDGRDKCPILGEVELRNVFGKRIYHPDMTAVEQTSMFHASNNANEFDNINRCQRYRFTNVWFNDPTNTMPERLFRTSAIVSVSDQYYAPSGRTETMLSFPNDGNRVQDKDGNPARILIGVPNALVTPGGVDGTMLDPNHMPGLDYEPPGYQ